MDITVYRDQLTSAVTAATQGLPDRPDMPVRAGLLMYVLDDHAHLTCGDGSSTFTARLPLDPEEGQHYDVISRILPGKLLADLLRFLPPKDEITLSFRDSQVTVTCGKASFTLGTQPGENYPMWQTPPAPLCTLDGAVLASGLRKVAPAASDEDPLLAGVMLELSGDTLTVAATDKYRLGVAELAIDFPGTRSPSPFVAAGTNALTAFLPAKVAEKFARLCDGGTAAIGWSDGLVSLHCAGLMVSARQTEMRFPSKWRSIVATEGSWWACETPELIRAVRMTALAASPDPTGRRDFRLQLAFTKGQVTVSAGGAAFGFAGGAQQQVGVSNYDGEDVILAVGGRNLLAGLMGCESPVSLSFTSPAKPLLLDSGGLRWMVQTRRSTENA
jgi:DNA polymerase III subunit beta